MPIVEPMLPVIPKEGESGTAPYTIEDDTLDRAAIYGPQNYPEIRSKQNPVDLYDTYTYTFTADDNVSPISGG